MYTLVSRGWNACRIRWYGRAPRSMDMLTHLAETDIVRLLMPVWNIAEAQVSALLCLSMTFVFGLAEGCWVLGVRMQHESRAKRTSHIFEPAHTRIKNKGMPSCRLSDVEAFSTVCMAGRCAPTSWRKSFVAAPLKSCARTCDVQARSVGSRAFPGGVCSEVCVVTAHHCPPWYLQRRTCRARLCVSVHPQGPSPECILGAVQRLRLHPRNQVCGPLSSGARKPLGSLDQPDRKR